MSPFIEVLSVHDGAFTVRTLAAMPRELKNDSMRRRCSDRDRLSAFRGEDVSEER